MSEKLNGAIYALLAAIDDELMERDTRINMLTSKINQLTDQTDCIQKNLKNTAGILSTAARALQEGLK